MAAVLAGWAGSRAVGPRLAPLLQGHVPAFAAHPIAGVVSFLACTAAAAIAARLLFRLTPLRRIPGGRFDRSFGAILGGIQAGLIVWVVLSALAVWNRPVRLGPLLADPRDSGLTAFARENSAFGTLTRTP